MTAPSTFHGPRPLTTLVSWLRRGFVFTDDEGDPERAPVFVQTIGALWSAHRPYESEAPRDATEARYLGSRAEAVLAWVAHRNGATMAEVRHHLGIDAARRLSTLVDLGFVVRVGERFLVRGAA